MSRDAQCVKLLRWLSYIAFFVYFAILPKFNEFDKAESFFSVLSCRLSKIQRKRKYIWKVVRQTR